MPKSESEPLTCRYCVKKGVKREFKAIQGLCAHERLTHDVFRRGKKGKRHPKPGGETIVQESICYCPFCGKQLPNATIIKS